MLAAEVCVVNGSPYHVVFALAMSANRVIAGPEDEIVLALVALHLEIVHFAVLVVRSPD